MWSGLFDNSHTAGVKANKPQHISALEALSTQHCFHGLGTSNHIKSA